MKYWTHVVVEGHCFGEEDKNNNNPCGRDVPSVFCLGDGVAERCPHFMWANATERDAAHFVPFYLLLKDRCCDWGEKIGHDIRWWFWGQLWFNRRKVDEFFKNIKTVTASESPMLAKLEKEEQKAQKKFDKWFIKVKKFEKK